MKTRGTRVKAIKETVEKGIDMTKKTTLYKQTKSSLIKFFASVKPQQDCQNEEPIAATPHECKLDSDDTLYQAGAYGSNQGSFNPGFSSQGLYQYVKAVRLC